MTHITIQDIAKEAKVSLGTVSRVINNNPQVREDTKKRVLDVIKKRNYSPNNSARMLPRLSRVKPLKKECIGIVLAEHVEGGFSNQTFAGILEGAIREAGDFKYRVMPDYIKDKIEFKSVANLDEVIDFALLEAQEDVNHSKNGKKKEDSKFAIKTKLSK